MTTLILDHFTGTNGDNLHGRTPDTTNTPGHTWDVFAGHLHISGSNNAVTGDFGDCFATIDAGVADGVVSVALAPSASYGQYVFFRYSDSSNYWYAMLYGGSFFGFRLYKRVSGSDSLVATGADLSGGVQTVQITLSGNAISATIAGGNLISTSDSFNSTATKHGFGGDTFDSTAFDDFQFDGSAGGGTNQFPAIAGYRSLIV